MKKIYSQIVKSCLDYIKINHRKPNCVELSLDKAELVGGIYCQIPYKVRGKLFFITMGWLINSRSKGIKCRRIKNFSLKWNI